jgi:hypothetical protein
MTTQVLASAAYFTRRVSDEAARSRRSGTQFSVAVFSSRPEPGEAPEIACVRSLPAILANVRDTDTVCRIADDSIAVLLIDAAGEGARRAALRLLERMGPEAGRWDVSVLEYPDRESVLQDLGLVSAP